MFVFYRDFFYGVEYASQDCRVHECTEVVCYSQAQKAQHATLATPP